MTEQDPRSWRERLTPSRLVKKAKSKLGKSSTLPPSTPQPLATPPSVPAVASAPPASASTLSVASAVASTSGSPSPWELALDIARQKLCEHQLPPLCERPGQRASEIVQLTIEDLQVTIKSTNQNRSKAAERLQGILKTFDKYSKIVDVAIQHSPEITALVWAGVRATLQIALNHIETMESLEVAIALIAEKMAVCEFFATIYEEVRNSGITLSSIFATKSLQQTLDLALPEFYAAILVFSVKARQYFDPSTTLMTKLKYMLKPSALEFKLFINEITEKERRVRDCADMATMGMIRKSSGRVEQLSNILTDDVQPKLVPLVTELEGLAKMTKEILQSILKAEAERVRNLLQMLTTLESQKRHQDVRLRRLDGTGTWLLQHERFLMWRNGFTQASDAKNRVLCCYGDPGAGKTVMSSIVFDNLESQFPQRDYVGIAIIYCDYRDQKSQTLVNILGNILHQFLSAASTIPDTVMECLESIQKRGRNAETNDILEILKSALTSFTHTFVCIDALDELEAKTRFDVLASLRDEFKTTRIFLTGRPHIQQDVNESLKTHQHNVIHISPDLGDIRIYLQHTIMEDRRIYPDAMDDKLEEEILTTITERSKGMFLLPALHIRAVLEECTIAKRRKMLQILPESLNDAFTHMVNRILESPRYKYLGKQMLLLLHFAYRPLKVTELQHALAVEPCKVMLDKDDMLSRKDLLDCCLGLVVVDEETMTVRFVHYTLEEHFKEHRSTYFPNGYTNVAEICLTYLNFDELNHHCATFDDLKGRQTEFAFLEYAAFHWGHYARQQSNEPVTQLASKLLQERERPQCAIQSLYSVLGNQYRKQHTLLWTGLHVAAYFGLEKVIVALESNTQHWDPSDESERTPLSWAAEKGHEAVVRLLLERADVDVNSTDKDDRSPLSWAALKGYETVVRLLLERADVDVNSKDKDGRSPLSWAALKGYEAVVRLLLERADVDVNSKAIYGWSPLLLAALNGDEVVVKLLLEHADVDVNSKDKDGRSSLVFAALKGHEAVVRLLLARTDVDVNSKDKDGQSPLLLAALNRAEAVMKLLLERVDVDVNSKDKDGRSPLSWAALKGYEAVVRLLLTRTDVDANSKDKDGRSPLLLAALNRDEVVVKLLLERADVDVNSIDIYGWSPLLFAASEGYEAIVKLLLERVDVDVNINDDDGQSPLSLAALKGYEAIVRLLLVQADVDVNSKDTYGWSPLLLAALNGDEVVVRLLLEQADVDVNSKDKDGRSPLSWAALKGYEAVVRLLFERTDVDVNSKDIYGRSPLLLAALSGDEVAVKLLLERADVDVNSKDIYGRSSLSFAAMNGDEVVVKLLLERVDVDVNSKDKDGQPLLWATLKGYEAVVMLLLEQANADVNIKDEYGRSPLSLAALNGDEVVVSLLLERGDVDVNSKDTFGRSPLLLAALNRDEAVVKLLLERVDVDINSKDNYGQSPLSWAARLGYEAIVRLLLERADVDVNSKDEDHRSPLSWAAEMGHEGVVELLHQYIASSPAAL